MRFFDWLVYDNVTGLYCVAEYHPEIDSTEILILDEIPNNTYIFENGEWVEYTH
jgi:hypothetical protein